MFFKTKQDFTASSQLSIETCFSDLRKETCSIYYYRAAFKIALQEARDNEIARKLKVDDTLGQLYLCSCYFWNSNHSLILLENVPIQKCSGILDFKKQRSSFLKAALVSRIIH